MGRKRTYAPLDVYMNRRKVGQYFREPDGAFAFIYAADWLAWPCRTSVSSASSVSVIGVSGSKPWIW